MELANMVCEHINDLMMELKVLNREFNRRNSVSEEQPSTSATGTSRGFLVDRFTNDNVVITAPTKLKAGSDLQLPTMGTLVSKTSSQAFFLRILKVIVQIREAVRHANTKAAAESNAAASAAVAAAAASATIASTVAMTPAGDTTMETAPTNNVTAEEVTNDNATDTDAIAMDTSQATITGK